MLNEFFRDLRFGARLLRRNAAFTSTAVLSLALGIGGATAVFTLVNAIVLRTLPVPQPGQLYRAVVEAADSRSHGELFSMPFFFVARDALAASHVELSAATSPNGVQLQPEGDEIATRGNVQLVSGEYFTMLGARAQLGRLFAPSDDVTVGAHPVVVISDAYWRRAFAAAPDAVGRRLSVNGESLTIVGVTAPGFFGTSLNLRGPDAWVPLMMQPTIRYAASASSSGDSDTRKPWPPQPRVRWVTIFARVPPGAAATAAAALTTLAQRDRESDLGSHPSADDIAQARHARVALESAATGVSALRASVSKPLYVLLAMVGVLLAIACGNVAGLLLSRSAAREREMAIRLSIGAARSRLVRQLIAESLLLACGGGALGIVFAVWARDALLALLVNVGASSVPVDLNTNLDWRVLAFATGVSIVTGLACGVLPAFRVTRVAVAQSLKEQSRAVGGEGSRGGLVFGKALVAAQMAFCLLLLVIAALFARSLRSLMQADIGFDRDHVLTARVDVLGAGYNSAERQALYSRLIDRLGAVPGVTGVAFSMNGPLANSSRSSGMTVEGHHSAPHENLTTNEETVTAGYFDTVGLRILEGRGFTAEDRNPELRHTVINQTMAKRFFPGQSAVGKRWSYGDAIGKHAFVIVGVVEDARYLDIRASTPNMAYHLADASPDDVMSDIELRTAGAPETLAQTVRDTIARTEPRLPVVEVVPLGARVERGTTEDRMVAHLTTIFGALALLLASLGLYGTISYGIARRTGELGLRMALGADRRMVLLMVMREALVLVLAGLAAGIPIAFAAAQSVATLLFAVNPTDPLAFAGGAAMLSVVGALAAYLPAYRASRIEPMVALGR